MAKLHLRFSGLCAFVPYHPDRDQATVLLVDAGQPSGPHDKPHVAAVVFTYASWLDNGHLPGSQYRYFDDTFHDANDELMGICYIAGEEIKIDKALAHKLVIEGPDTVKGCPDTSGREDHYFAWVAPMDLINVGSGDARDSCFLAAGADPSVVARIRLTEGNLRTLDFAVDNNSGAVLQWEFKPTMGGNPAAQTQALAEEVELLTPLGTAYADLLSSADIHGTPMARKPLRLHPQGRDVVAWIVNMPLDEIKLRGYSGGFQKPSTSVKPPRGPDHHFVHFYDLLRGGSSNRVPHPLSATCAGANRPSVESPRCPPSQLKPHPAA